jgi:class 3 adenylate cyclase
MGAPGALRRRTPQRSGPVAERRTFTELEPHPEDGTLLSYEVWASPRNLRIGIHYGPCIAVTLNRRLDYFGSVVNKAARLEGLSSGDDVIISDAVRADPEVDQMLQLDDCGAEAFETQIKGFDDHFALWRVLPNR